MRSTNRTLLILIVAGTAVATLAAPAAASQAEGDLPSVQKAQEFEKAKEDTKSKEKGGRAGFRVGHWGVQDLEELSGADYSDTPALEGYFEKDLDVRVSIESTLGLWRRKREQTQTDPLSGTSTEEVNSWVLPMFSAIKFYPLKREKRRWAPHLSAGIGFAFGLEKTDGTGSFSPSSETRTGFGYKLGAGTDLNLGKAFGMNFGGRWQWLRFDQDLGGDETFRGFVVDAGFVYRFQYD